MQEKKNDFNELKEIRRKQYEESVLRKRQSLKKEKESKNTEESKPLLEPEPIKDEATTNIDYSINNNDNSKHDTSKQDLANERRKNRGIESKDSSFLHYLLIIYYNIKAFFHFIYMFLHSLVSPLAAKRYADKNKPKKYSSFDTFSKNNDSIDTSYMAYGGCC